MEQQIPFPEFIQVLKDQGATIAGAAFLAGASSSWKSIPVAVRKDVLAHFAIDADPHDVSIRLGKVPGSVSSLDNVLVILDYIEGPPRLEDEAESAHGDRQPAAAQAPAREAEPPEEPIHAAAPPPQEAEPEEAPLQLTGEVAEAPAEDAPSGQASAGWFGFGKKKDKTERPVFAGEVTPIPPITAEGVEEIEIYPVQAPYAFVRIMHDTIHHEYRYEVIEPPLSERESNVLDFIESTIVDVIEVGLTATSKEDARQLLLDHMEEVIYDYSIVMSPLTHEKVKYYLLRDFLGFGIIDPIMNDEFIEDVSCDGPHVPIFLYHRKYESIKSTTTFGQHDPLDAFVIKMAQRSGKHVSIAEPLLDATLPDGSRLNATLSDEVTSKGSTFTIRKFREDPFTIPDLVRFGTMNDELVAYWWLAVENGASAIYAGGTASGKTTSLNAILLFIPPQMKIVSIEDTREINLPHENWIAGVTRSGFGPRDNSGRQAGEIDMFTLLKAALRQRPEYILVGEVRGEEATALFQAMATGHTAYGTMHADSAEAVIHRLESEPINIPRSLLEALDIVSIQIQTRIDGKRVRRTKELVEIVGLDPHTREILTNQVFTWSPANDDFEYSGVSYVLERIQVERNITEREINEEFQRRKSIIAWMVANDIRDLADVGRIIATYYKDPDAVMRMLDLEPEEVREVLQDIEVDAGDEVTPEWDAANALPAPAGQPSSAGNEPGLVPVDDADAEGEHGPQ